MAMNHAEIKQAVVDYLHLIHHGTGSPESDIEALEKSLDHLAVAYRESHYQFEANHPDPPSIDYAPLRDEVSGRFTMFGFYNHPEFVTNPQSGSGLVLGDAIDDITDIARDLTDVAWCWEHTSRNDALWHFRIGFETHWGGHLRCLQWYLQCFKDEH